MNFSSMMSTRQTGNRSLGNSIHPAWDRTWRYVTFNAFVGGTRRVFVADMKERVG